MKVWNLYQKRGEFFTVQAETERCQTAAMTLRPGEDSGEERNGHPGDQVLYVAEGEVMISTPTGETAAFPGTVVLIPPRTRHRVRNVGRTSALLLAVYAPPAY